MERLIYSNSIPSKHHPNSPFLRRLARPESTRKLGISSFSSRTSFPLLLRPESRRFNPLSCSLNDSSCISCKAPDDSPEVNLSTSVDPANGSKPKPHFLKWVAQKLSQQQKVVKVAVGEERRRKKKQEDSVYVKAKECKQPLSVEDFAIVLGKHFTSFYPQVTAAIINIVEKPWERIHIDGFKLMLKCDLFVHFSYDELLWVIGSETIEENAPKVQEECEAFKECVVQYEKFLQEVLSIIEGSQGKTRRSFVSYLLKE